VEIDTRNSSTVRGRVVDPLGAPDARGKLTFHSHLTTLTTPTARDENGDFEQRLPPGAYKLVLTCDRAATRLAHFRLEPGQTLDLGVLATPELGTLRLSARRSGLGFSLFSLSENPSDRGFIHVTNGPVDGELVIPTFPGRYRMLTFDGPTSRTTSEFDVRPNVETHVELGL